MLTAMELWHGLCLSNSTLRLYCAPPPSMGHAFEEMGIGDSALFAYLSQAILLGAGEEPVAIEYCCVYYSLLSVLLNVLGCISW